MVMKWWKYKMKYGYNKLYIGIFYLFFYPPPPKLFYHLWWIKFVNVWDHIVNNVDEMEEHRMQKAL